MVILISSFLNHLKFGNSSSTISHAEFIQYQLREYKKRVMSKELADYMYNRIKFYQEIDTWYERHYTFEYMYEVLQKRI